MSRTEQMTEFDERVVAEAEANLDRLLSIEPSPEFVAKVRARIAAEPPVRSWNWSRLLVPLVAAACFVLAVVVWHGRNAERPFAVERQGDIVLRDEKPKEPLAPVIAGPIAINRPAVSRAAAPIPREPEIIIDPSMAEAIRRLAVGTRNTTLDGSYGESIAADAHAGALAIAEPLIVPELVLSPADPNGGQ